MADTGKRTTWIPANQVNPGKWAFLRDMWDENTTYHLEPAEVKIKVGWVGYLALATKLAIILYLVYQLVTSNVAMQEVEPNSMFALWAEGSLQNKSEEQFVNTDSDSLCRMSEKFDYLYGEDNKWAYTANACRFVSLDELAIKSPTAVQYVTYQHERKIVRVSMTNNCETECQQVYPEWPNAAAFGDQQMKVVYVNTPVDAVIREHHTDLPENANIHLMKPTQFGTDQCECWANQNTFNLGVDDAEFVFTHGYDVTGEASGSSKGTSEHDPVSFLVGEGADEPYKTYEKGEANRFKISEVMDAVGACLDCQPEADFFENSICTDGVCPGAQQLKPTPRMSGAAIDITTEYYNHRITMPSGGAYDWIRQSEYDPPYAIHIVRNTEDWSSMGANVKEKQSWNASMQIYSDIYRYGILVRINPARGIIAHFNSYVLVNWLVNAIVLMGLPGAAISALVFYGLGRRSQLYMKAKRKILDVDNLYRSFSMSAMVANGVFEHMSGADSSSQKVNGFITKSDLIVSVSGLLKPKLLSSGLYSEAEVDQKISEYVEEIMVDDYHPEGDDGKPVLSITERGMSHSGYIKASAFGEAIEWDDLMQKLKNLDGDKEVVSKVTKRMTTRSSTKISPLQPSQSEENTSDSLK